MIQVDFMPLDSDAFKPYEGTPDLLTWLQAHFGLEPEVFDGHRFWCRPGREKLWLATAETKPIGDGFSDSLGILALRGAPPRLKPTSVFLQQFAHTANRNVYVLSNADGLRFLQRKTLEVKPVDDQRGYCVVRTIDTVLGCGRIHGRQLLSEVPSHWAKAFARPLERYAGLAQGPT